MALKCFPQTINILVTLLSNNRKKGLVKIEPNSNLHRLLLPAMKSQNYRAIVTKQPKEAPFVTVLKQLSLELYNHTPKS